MKNFRFPVILTFLILVFSLGVGAQELVFKEELVIMLDDSEADNRILAIDRLEELNLIDQLVIEKLVDLLDDSDYNVAQAANRGLISAGVKAVPYLANGMFGKYDSSAKITVRQNITRILGQIGGEASVDVLIQSLFDSSSQIRRAAALALEQIGPEAIESSVPLAKLLLNRDEEPQARAAAAQALGKIGYQDDLIIFALSLARVETAFQVVWAAQGALSNLNIDTADFVSAILEQLDHEEYAALASDALVHVINTTDDTLDIIQDLYNEYAAVEEEEVAVQEEQAMLQDEQKAVQITIVSQLAASFNQIAADKQAQTLEILQTGLLEDDSEIQLAIAKNLAGASHEAASLQGNLMSIIRNSKSNYQLRLAALHAMEWLAEPDSKLFSQLVALAFDRNENQEIRNLAIRTIARSRSHQPNDLWPLLAQLPLLNEEQLWMVAPLFVIAGQAEPALVQELTNLVIDAEQIIQLFAIRCLSGIGEKAEIALPALIDIVLNHSNDDYRIAATRAIVQIGKDKPELQIFLQGFASDQNPNVQRIASQGLGTWKLPTPTKILAFPSAQGFGAWTPGGREGKIYIVTNLNDKGPGSLREAVEASGPRIVVFNVSGTIFLESTLRIQNPYITIAGQTAPGYGITIANHETSVETHDVIIRHLRFRLGDLKRSEADALGVNGANNVIIDHVSASWGMDETLSVSESDNVTVQWSFITESMRNSYHSKGPHGYGSLVRGGYGGKYTFINNLWAHHMGRMPRPGNYNSYKVDPEGLFVDFRNNVFYNWGGNVSGANNDRDSVTKYNFINNYYIRGVNSTGSLAFREYSTKAQAYFAGNFMNGIEPADPWSLVDVQISWDIFQNEYKQTTPFYSGHVTTVSALEAYELVLAEAGAQPRDAIDQRVQQSVIDMTGRHIDSQIDVGGWPNIPLYPPAKDSNNDGIPDWWYVKHGFNPIIGLPPELDLNGDGYTVIEDYLNGTDPDLI